MAKNRKEKTKMFMIRPLRKRHLQIWIGLAVIIPSLIVSAVLVRPVFPEDKLLQPPQSRALPVLLKSLDRDAFSICIRSNNDTTQLQLEWINKKPLTYPTSAIYQTAGEIKSIDKAVLIGKIESRGRYYFYLPVNQTEFKSGFHFIWYDFIHQSLIENIHF